MTRCVKIDGIRTSNIKGNTTIMQSLRNKGKIRMTSQDDAASSVNVTGTDRKIDTPVTQPRSGPVRLAKAKMQKPQRVRDYGNDQINRLALAQDTFERMEADERSRAFIWFKSKYSKEWPSDTYN